MSSRQLAGIGFLVGLTIFAGLSAEEGPKAETPPTSIATTATEAENPVAGKKKLEALLQTPAKLDFAGKSQVAAHEILDQLRAQHRLSIRFDLPTFAALLGREALLGLQENEEAEKPSAETVPAVTVVAPPPTDVQAAAPVTAVTPPSTTENNPGQQEASDSEGTLQKLLSVHVDLTTMNLQTTSIGTILKQLLESIPVSAEEAMGLPIPATNAWMLDYIVEQDGILITTRMQALTRKETRVYSVKNLKDCPPEQLASLIRKTIRPYSWRAQFDDFGEKLKGISLPKETVASLMQVGAVMAELENVTITSTEGAAPVTAPQVPANPEETAKQMEAAGGALANIFVALTHAGLLTVEMIHHADPPTATIETLPGKLVITQSQGAHREIAELLEELASE